MQEIISKISQMDYGHALSSLALIFSVVLIRNLTTRKIRNSDFRTEDKRKWFVSIRNWSTLVLILGLGTIWATELQTFALSIVAILGAMIISGKELFLCALGGLLRSFNHMFKVGDRIEILGVRGDVIDTNLMVTKLLEIGPQNFTHQFTGRSIVIPNSLFLSKELINESFTHKYVLHVFKVTFNRKEDWKYAEKCMMDAANEVCGDFIESARKNMDNIASREGLEVPSANPRITYKFSNASDVEMIVRVPSPANKKGNIEQEVLKRFMVSYMPTETTQKDRQ